MKILIAIDESACAAVAFDAVLRFLCPDDTEFRLISVVEPMSLQYLVGVTGVDIEPMLKADLELRNQRQEFLRLKTAELQKIFPGKSCSAAVMIGVPADCILQEATIWQADVIVLGSHSRHGLQKILLGSVAEKVMRYAACSVSVIRQTPIAPTESSLDTKEGSVESVSAETKYELQPESKC